LSGSRTLAKRTRVDRRSHRLEVMCNMRSLRSRWAANPNTSPPGIAHPLFHPFGHEATLKLCHGSQDGEKELALGRGRIDVLG